MKLRGDAKKLMAVLLSIKPKYVELILSGKKQIELRKKLWNENKRIKRVYVYSSNPIKKIVGYFEIEHIYRESLHILWMLSKNLACISKEEFDTYYSNHTHGTGIFISKVKKFKIAIDPLELDSNFNAPQNFCYISKEFSSKLNEIEVER